MSLSAIVQAMADEGMTGQEIARVLARMEESRKAKSRAGNAERQRRFQAAKKANEANANNDVNANNGVSGVIPVTDDAGTDLARAGGIPNPSLRSGLLDNPPVIPQTKTSLRSEENSEQFARFRKAYPRRRADNWDRAEKAFLKAIRKGADPEAMIAGAETYRVSREGEDPQFTQMAASWINDRGWIVDYAPIKARAGPKARGTNGWAELSRELNGRSDGQQPHQANGILDLEPARADEPRYVGSSRVDAEPGRAASERRSGDPRDCDANPFRAQGAGRPTEYDGDVFEPRRPGGEGPRHIADVFHLPVRASGQGGGG